MSLLQPRVTTPARWAADRRNAQKSTGPRTASAAATPRTGVARSERSQELIENKGSSQNKNPAKLTSN
jgi:hypothetical protein